MPNKGYFIQQMTRQDAGTLFGISGEQDTRLVPSVKKNLINRPSPFSRWRLCYARVSKRPDRVRMESSAEEDELGVVWEAMCDAETGEV